MKRKNKKKDKNEYRKNKKNNYKRIVLKKLLKCTFKISCISFVFITILGCMYGYSEVSKLKYEIGELESKLHKKTIERDNIQVEVDLLTKSKDIEKKANEELGMDYPKENQIKYIEVSK